MWGVLKIKNLVLAGELITCDGKKTITGGGMIIESGQIKDILRGREVRQRKEDFSGAEIIDYSSYTIIPGLIDSHTHLSIVPGEGNQLEQIKRRGQYNILKSIPNLYRNLDSGVTTLRVMGEENFIDLDIKEAVEKGDLIAPRILAAGKGIVSVNGHGAAITVCDGSQEIRKQIRKNFARGADHVKLFVTGGISTPDTTLELASYSREEIMTAVREAEMAGSYAAAHVHGGIGMDLCIDCGVRTLEHAAFINSEQLERVIEKDLWLTGTFSILFHPEGIEKTDFANRKIREKVLKAREFIRRNFAKVVNSGVNLILGTDSMHGYLLEEIKFVAELGLDNYSALRAVTRDAARACGVGEQLGQLKEDYVADFVVLEDNPLENLSSLKQIEAVYKEGKKVKG